MVLITLESVVLQGESLGFAGIRRRRGQRRATIAAVEYALGRPFLEHRRPKDPLKRDGE